MKIVGSQYLDPAVLARLPNLEFAARRLVDGAFVGYHKSPKFGYSVEFVDHRDYARGDDPRSIDWKVWARKDKYYVKRYEMESQLKATVLLDVSRSMDFGEGALTKLAYGSYLAASLCYMVIHQNDMAGLVTFDERIRSFIPARGSRAHLRAVLSALGSVKPGPKTDVGKSCHHLAETIGARGMVIVISDLLDDPESVLSGLRHFQHKKHDVIVFHLLDDAELDFGYDELANFRDVEGGERVAVDPATFREEYRARIGGFCSELKEGCRKSAIDYVAVRTSTPIEKTLGDYIRFRARRSI